MSEENKFDELTKIVQLEKSNRISELYNIHLGQTLYLKNFIQNTKLYNEVETAINLKRKYNKKIGDYTTKIILNDKIKKEIDTISILIIDINKEVEEITKTYKNIKKSSIHF